MLISRHRIGDLRKKLDFLVQQKNSKASPISNSCVMWLCILEQIASISECVWGQRSMTSYKTTTVHEETYYQGIRVSFLDDSRQKINNVIFGSIYRTRSSCGAGEQYRLKERSRNRKLSLTTSPPPPRRSRVATSLRRNKISQPHIVTCHFSTSDHRVVPIFFFFF